MLEVRFERPGDEAAIDATTVAAFISAAHKSGTEQFIIRALREAGCLTLSLVADQHGEVVGHAAVSPVTLSDGTVGWYGLGPVSVRPSHQKHGVGSTLIQQAISMLRRHGAKGCVVLGDPAYYSRFGFSADPRLSLADVPAEYFQALTFAGEAPTARVTYHQAFEATG